MKKNVLRFLGNTELIEKLAAQGEVVWIDTQFTPVIQKHYSKEKKFYVLRATFNHIESWVDVKNAQIVFIESGEERLESELLEEHLLRIFAREKVDEKFELLLFWGELNTLKEDLKNINYQAMLAKEQVIAKNLDLKLGDEGGKIINIR